MPILIAMRNYVGTTTKTLFASTLLLVGGIGIGPTQAFAYSTECFYSFKCSCQTGFGKICEYDIIAKKSGGGWFSNQEDAEAECKKNLLPDDVDKRLEEHCKSLNKDNVQSCSYVKGSRSVVTYKKK